MLGRHYLFPDHVADRVIRLEDEMQGSGRPFCFGSESGIMDRAFPPSLAGALGAGFFFVPGATTIPPAFRFPRLQAPWVTLGATSRALYANHRRSPLVDIAGRRMRASSS